MINSEYPGSALYKWTFFDSRGTVSGQSQNISVNIAKSENSRSIFEVIQNPSIQDIERIIKIGKLYKSQNPNYPLTCFILTPSNVQETVMNMANRCKIKIFKI